VHAGTLLSLDGQVMTLYYAGHSFTANALTGALQLPQADLYFTSNDCSGQKYTPPSYSAQIAVKSNVAGDTDSYKLGDAAMVDVQSYWQQGFFGNPAVCQVGSFSQTLYSLSPMTPADLPAALTGPLRFAPAA
jgi:hypothetical protein